MKDYEKNMREWCDEYGGNPYPCPALISQYDKCYQQAKAQQSDYNEVIEVYYPCDL